MPLPLIIGCADVKQNNIIGDYEIMTDGNHIKVMTIQMVKEYQNTFKRLSDQDQITLAHGDTVPYKYTCDSLIISGLPYLYPLAITEKYFISNHVVVIDKKTILTGKPKPSFLLFGAIILAIILFMVLGWKVQLGANERYCTYGENRWRLIGQLILVIIGMILASVINSLATVGVDEQVFVIIIQIIIACVGGLIIRVSSSDQYNILVATYIVSVSLAGAFICPR